MTTNTSDAPRTRTSTQERNRMLFAEYRRAAETLAEREAADDGSAAAARAIARARRRVEAAQDTLVRENLALAGDLAKRFSRGGTHAGEDYRSAAVEGLCEALFGGSGWDPERASLGHWARRFMLDRLLTEVRRQEHRTLSRHDFAVRRAILNAAAELGPDATTAAIADRCGLPVSQVARVRQLTAAGNPASLDAPAGEDRTLAEVVADPRASEAEVIPPASAGDLGPAQVDPEFLSARIADLGELVVLLRHYGLDGAPPEPLASIAALLGESKETARQRVLRAADRLL